MPRQYDGPHRWGAPFLPSKINTPAYTKAFNADNPIYTLNKLTAILRPFVESVWAVFDAIAKLSDKDAIPARASSLSDLAALIHINCGCLFVPGR